MSQHAAVILLANQGELYKSYSTVAWNLWQHNTPWTRFIYCHKSLALCYNYYIYIYFTCINSHVISVSTINAHRFITRHLNPNLSGF